MGDDVFYKYSKIADYIQRENRPPIQSILEIGFNRGIETEQIRRQFPKAWIDAYEPARCWLNEGVFRLANNPRFHMERLRIFHGAVTNIGIPARLDFALGGGNASGGSIVVPKEQTEPDGSRYDAVYEDFEQVTLKEALDRVCTGTQIVDLIKMDCEGSERSILGAADIETLKRVRFITGEYHNLDEFLSCGVLDTLWKTHCVNVEGRQDLGSFLATLKGVEDGFLYLVDDTHKLDSRISYYGVKPAVEVPIGNSLDTQIPGMYRYVRVGYDERVLELLSDGRIGEGIGSCEKAWLLTRDGLLLSGEQGNIALLNKHADGWSGHWLKFEKMPIELKLCRN